MSSYLLVAGVIAAHKNSTINGRTRLQKTIYLLQHLGLNTDYRYKMYYYGPYSNELTSDIQLLEKRGIIQETEDVSSSNHLYSIFKATSTEFLSTINTKIKGYISIFSEYPPVHLELASTLIEYGNYSNNMNEALSKLKEKKPKKCTDENLTGMNKLLAEVGLGVA